MDNEQQNNSLKVRDRHPEHSKNLTKFLTAGLPDHKDQPGRTEIRRVPVVSTVGVWAAQGVADWCMEPLPEREVRMKVQTKSFLIREQSTALPWVEPQALR